MRLLLGKNKIILFRIFIRVGLFVFGKICLLGLSFVCCFAISHFCWGNFFGLIYFVLDCRSINFFMTIKRRKMVELQFFLQIADMVSGSK